MATGRKLVLTGVTITDETAPVLVRIDPIESEGSLFLLDATHPVQQWPSGVPSNGGPLPNLFADRAAALTGVAPSALDGVTKWSGMSGAQGLLERSEKGGLHAIYSNTNETNTGNSSSCYVLIEYSADLIRYIGEHYDDELYLSYWAYATRPQPGGGEYNTQAAIAYVNTSTSNYKYLVGANAIDGGSGLTTKRVSVVGSPGGGTGPIIQNVSRAGHSNAAPNNVPNYDDQCTYPWQIGNARTVNSYMTAKANVMSAIVYRLYLENLTVSGRPYDEVDAIDYALFEKEVLTPGGRYYGDTFTDPATIP